MGVFQNLNQRIKGASIGKFKKKLYLIGLSYLLLLVSFAVSLFFDSRILIFVASILISGGMLSYAVISIFKRNVAQLLEIKELLTSLLDGVSNYHPRLKEALSDIYDRDFTRPVKAPEKGEIQMPEYDELLRLLKNASERIKSTNLLNLRISFDLARSIQNLVLTSNIQASGSSEQASSVAEITATMEELARTAAQIAENSNKVAKQADDSDKTSKKGFTLVNNVIQAIETIDAKMNQISQKTQVLGTQSKQIGKVLDIIYDIANETHLLALNATIESVAAGEFGKRFGVVAAEVRRLAESARENAESIKTIIEEFQDSINTTILSIDEGSKMTSNVNRTAQEIINNFSHITESVAQTSQNANEISIATQQQRSASDQIVLTLKDVAEVTKIQAEELKKSSVELENLSTLALNLQLLTQQAVIDSPLSLGFKIRGMAASPEIYAMEKRGHRQALRQLLNENEFIELIYITDHEGKLYSWETREEREETADILRLGNDFSNRSWYMNAAKSHKPYISEVYKSLLSKEDCFSVSVGIFDEKSSFIGVIAIDINALEWNKIVL
jgi:methyl-accepting chemotaxis protein